MSNAQQIVEALGGAENLVAVESCITRVRVEVSDPEKVREDGLREAGAFDFTTYAVYAPCRIDHVHKEVRADD